MDSLERFVRDLLRHSPFRTMHCSECSKTVRVAAWWTPDKSMLDWYCPECESPLETVVLTRNRKLTEYMLDMLYEEYGLF